MVEKTPVAVAPENQPDLHSKDAPATFQDARRIRRRNKLSYPARVYTPRKMANRTLCRFERMQKRPSLRAFPIKLTVETGNFCNLQCPLCPTGQKDESVNRGYIPMETYTRIFDQLGPYLFHADLFNWGEPLLNKNIVEMIKYALNFRIAVRINSNLNILTEELAEQLMQTRLDVLSISCDGASRDSYAKYHVGGDYATVVDNMRLLARKRKELGNNTTRIIWSYHVFRHNENEVESGREQARQIGVEFRTRNIRTDMGKEIFEKPEQSIERDKEWIPTDPKYSAYDVESKVARKNATCDRLWTETTVNWDGAIIPCCAVPDTKYSFGNINEHSFEEIWNGEKYVSARKEVASGGGSPKTICHICKENEFLHI